MKERKIIILKYMLGGAFLFGITVGTVGKYYPEYKILSFVLASILIFGTIIFRLMKLKKESD